MRKLSTLAFVISVLLYQDNAFAMDLSLEVSGSEHPLATGEFVALRTVIVNQIADLQIRVMSLERDNASQSRLLQEKEQRIQQLEAWMTYSQAHPFAGMPDWEHSENMLSDGKAWNAERIAAKNGWIYAKGFVGDRDKGMGNGYAYLTVNGQEFCIAGNSLIHSSLVVPVSKDDKYRFSHGCGLWTDGTCHMALRFYPNK